MRTLALSHSDRLMGVVEEDTRLVQASSIVSIISHSKKGGVEILPCFKSKKVLRRQWLTVDQMLAVCQAEIFSDAVVQI